AQARVTLDQQSVGRLSRMDAMQQQAMAQATGRRRQASRVRIAAALARMDEAEYGYCSECGDEIAPARLQLDPAIPTCLSCAKG
ncbi:MAG: TraR/DksA C4-type zinc finger protein, partial [Alphaproteobacteria bacterium]|nr:TraR/DksA C4-type zinc finger protein [Alphaproteobacteria bacterium]